MKLKISLLLILAIVLGCKTSKKVTGYDATSGATKIVNTIHYPQEKHLKNIKQLTFGGDNAEAYWSFNGENLVFQSNNKKNTF